MRLVFLFVILLFHQNVLAQINNWHISNPSDAPSHLNIYQGPAFADAAFKQAGQNLVLNLSDFPPFLIQQVRYRLNGSGSWTHVSAGYPYVSLGNLTGFNRSLCCKKLI